MAVPEEFYSRRAEATRAQPTEVLSMAVSDGESYFVSWYRQS